MNTTEQEAIAAQQKREAEDRARRDPQAGRVEAAGNDRVVLDDVNRYPGDHRNLPPGAEPPPVRTIAPSDLDAQDYVTVWDHGPRSSDYTDDDSGLPDGDRPQRETESDADAEWYRKNGDGPVPIRMHSSDAKHSMSVEPARYALEPLGVESADIDKKVKEIQDRRVEAQKRADENAAAVQYAIDYREAAASVMADRASVLAVKKAEDMASRRRPSPRHHPGVDGRTDAPKFGSQLVSKEAANQQKLDPFAPVFQQEHDKTETDRVAREKADREHKAEQERLAKQKAMEKSMPNSQATDSGF